MNWTFDLAFKMSALYIGVAVFDFWLWLLSSAACQYSSWEVGLMAPSNWIPVTHVGNLDCLPDFGLASTVTDIQKVNQWMGALSLAVSQLNL